VAVHGIRAGCKRKHARRKQQRAQQPHAGQQAPSLCSSLRGIGYGRHWAPPAVNVFDYDKQLLLKQPFSSL
jgi:hypothetical protein